MNQLDIWGGIECSHCRVGDTYSDQLTRNGHWHRLDDLDALADLGLKTLRYPLLWEHTCPDNPDTCDWAWPDIRLPRLRELGINPIIGLVHHGSGPRYTALHEDNFATGLAQHAARVAERYPWLTHFTPVNEPLTTARFSALYGHWYPHTADDRTFVRALLNQLEATRLSMQAIREIIPHAKLVQTEDLAQIHSTPAMRYQADFENTRRWLSFDILCGKVSPAHAFWKYLRQHGASEAELQSWVDNPCPPDVMGLNYYLTSERFLDEAADNYWPCHRASNHRQHYADVEAVRVGTLKMAGVCSLLMQAWQRYKLPVSITEAHLNCTREEQVRWLHYVWDEANAARAQGADVRAVTVWSLFGTFDWDSLLTRNVDSYETGVFDVRSGQLRPTMLAKLVRHLAHGQKFEHPIMQSLGWWQRPSRVQFQPSTAPAQPRVLNAVKTREKATYASRHDESENLEYAA
ncbi:family 1 glycosylhydrolase [Hymenobacter arizonensis]|uniref:Beta-glucosidase/6-phospho-beta-glucosidase/beta-galactosidase n=1 Tax=Hymenobacter arizonensis TaxID=1227077 RepID=A0A1I6ABW9_HYMAR|nr:family 1 glycosylhydrolase [Hymenobacter arizonensis]SFQ66181.1 Beta-glucosidase/6-phospho-beta-glucosidase/beta-galactosidase [Hymenobacter arizonensis]